MARIVRLPDELANQIAAGEVVERPASVVKELVENAIDAGARRIGIRVEFGGKKQVRVDDDGEGMAPEDARLAIERHATSKIRSADDLAAIRTLGFRGEALPSMASVSHFLLRTRARGSDSGTEVRVNGGLVASSCEIAAAEGTVVEIDDLFYNLPARRKFLKSDAAEAAQVSRVATQIALAHPEVGFSLVSAGRTVLQCPPVASLRDRLYQLYGERSDLLEVRRELGRVRLSGYVAALADRGPTRGPQNVFINRRTVKDRTIAHAIVSAYSTASTKERGPEVHLFLDMPPELVDVNVHPTKAEVRFRDQSFVHELVRRALMETLGTGGVPELQLRSEAAVQIGITPSLPGVLASGSYPNRWRPVPSAPPAGGELAPLVAAAVSTPSQMAAAVGRGVGDEPPVAEGSRPMIPLGQLRDTFIIAVDDAGLSIIDQHVAHERVLFERVMQRLSAGPLESQRLLVPMVFELPLSSRLALADHAVELHRFGYEVEPFGGSAIRVTAVPALLRAQDSSTALLALAEDLEGLDRGADMQEALRRIAALTACHAAVKANDPLTYEKMAHILDELRATAYSTICPHGRPVMLRLTRREIEKNFDRI